MNTVIEATSLTKTYRDTRALDGLSLEVGPGRILGLIGPNGAGKTTLLRTLAGLLRAAGKLSVLGLDPWREHTRLMRECAFIADTATLPRWARISQLFDYLAGIHPRFSRAEAKRLLGEAGIDPRRRIKTLSKGMIVQTHLALILAIDARLLTLDEPTLGLDLLFRKTFYTHLLNDYFDGDRTIVISTHQVEEVEHILTDVAFIARGRIVLRATMDELAERYATVLVGADRAAEARALEPVQEQTLLGRHVFLFANRDRERLAALGEVQQPRLTDLFLATMQQEDHS